MEVGIFYGDNWNEYRPISETKLWNWQQGSMLQWLGNKDVVIFNDWLDGAHRAHVFDTSSQKLATFDVPVAATSPDGSSFLSYSFDRLSQGLKGYGYFRKSGSFMIDGVAFEHSLVSVDCETGRASVLFTLEDIIGISKREFSTGAYHYFSHCLYSPKGDKALVFHRWIDTSDDVKTQALVYSFESNSVSILPLGEYISHASWLTQHEVVLYAQNLNGKRGYFVVNPESGNVSQIGENAFSSDGHPQARHDVPMILTDTYPDRYRMQKLYCFDLTTQVSHLLLSLKIPLRYRNTVRCDFHPRWDRTGKYVSFDSAHTGTRAHCTLHLDDIDSLNTPA
ncbi:hypothetical protein [Marinimicrobium sp. ABcell2]|uniref:hypothetical protein n=1 Tax=Marinimicrobium sp. ABcell2 TaxID=3069751 RepID=UPI0027B3D302|nr:hypothetical protein [Marinimicrobium sp. ABcell2]MDQ2075766.1 hypothetical protein [Marinimicrobium sp. ABcell2]